MGAPDHAVLFYWHDEELTEAAAAYLGRAIRAGGVVVVVATAAHRRAFEAALGAAGIDLEAARADGSWRTADADVTLASLLEGETVDPARFEEVVGAMVGGATATGRPVTIYGEMVALLWDAGRVPAVIDLEGLWNGLQARIGFDLLCAYPQRPVVVDHQAGSLGDVCRLHTSVIGSEAPVPSARQSFPEASDSPRAARWFVTSQLREWGEDPAVVDDAALVVTELATNAVLHARSAFAVEVRATDALVRIAVEDDGPDPPVRRGAALTGAASGRGLSLIAELAKSWGSERRGPGKVVWAELPRSGTAAVAPG